MVKRSVVAGAGGGWGVRNEEWTEHKGFLRQ